jgi:hypothetical protein
MIEPTSDSLESAWDAVHDATPTDWYVGRPSYHDERHDVTGSIPEIASCLRAIGAGRVRS